jgi:hypothetical protein
MEVELPNGVVITDVPDNATKEQVKAKAIAAGLAKAEDFGGSTPAVTEKPITSGVLMGMKDPISAGAQMLPRGLEYMTSIGGMFPNEVSKFFGSEAKRVDEMVKGEEQAYQEQRKAKGEEGFDWARMGGNVVSPANLAVGARAAQALSTAKPLTQALVTGAAGGVLQPVTNTEEFTEEKAKQAATGAVGGAVGTAAVKAAGKALNPLVSQAEQTMREMGIRMTPGQLVGKQAAGLEEFAKNMPLVGSYISQAKERQLFQFNKAVINKALGKVGEKLPEDVIGRDAVSHVRETLSGKYDDILSGVSFQLDKDITTDLGSVVRTAKLPSADAKQELNDVINREIYQQIPVGNTGVGVIDGQAYKRIESELRKTAASYLNDTSQKSQAIGNELRRVLDVMKTSLKRQNPKQTSALRRVDGAYGDLLVMETASANGGARNGVFTPQQYSTAVRQTDRTRSKKAFAQGKATGQDISDAALEVLGPISESTLEGRLTMGMAGVYGAAQNPAVAITVPVATKALYSDTGLKAIETIMRKRPEIAKKIGDTLTKRAAREGSITGAMVVEEYNRASKTEEERFGSKSVRPQTSIPSAPQPTEVGGKLYPNEASMRGQAFYSPDFTFTPPTIEEIMADNPKLSRSEIISRLSKGER